MGKSRKIDPIGRGIVDHGIVDHLMRVKSMERRVSRAFERSRGPWAGASLCRQLAELRMQVDLLDCALEAHESRKCGPRSQFVPVLPFRPRKVVRIG